MTFVYLWSCIWQKHCLSVTLADIPTRSKFRGDDGYIIFNGEAYTFTPPRGNVNWSIVSDSKD